MSSTARHLVVISYYDRRSYEPLRSLLTSMQRFDAGLPYAILVVVNRDAAGPLHLPVSAPATIVERQNTGMNIGAWDHGWRTSPMYDGYLFLQDECYAVRPGWLSTMAAAADKEGVGLVGESFNEKWFRPWDELRQIWTAYAMREHLIHGKPANRVDVYLDFLRRVGVPAGKHGGHLRSLVWYLKRAVLEKIDGFPIGRNYGECIAAEIAVSKRAEALGLHPVQATPEPFYYLRHLEWVQEPISGRFVHRKLN